MHSSSPVSYTHLDVYKRQGMDAGPETASNHDDALLNNANQDAAGFLNTGLGAAVEVQDLSLIHI